MIRLVRIGIIVLGLLGILYLFNGEIRTKEQVITEGETLLLQLRPVDPRALMQGDYMRLDYAADSFPDRDTDLDADGTVILALDENRIGTFKRLDDGSTLTDGELKIKYALSQARADYGGHRFFFQEGTASVYDNARYGVFRVDTDGTAILVGLAGDDFQILLPPEPDDQPAS